MNIYTIAAGTPVSRRALQPLSWETFTTKKNVIYEDTDVVTHGTADINYVFQLPAEANPWVALSVKTNYVDVWKVTP